MLTVLMATHNGSDTIDLTLRSFCAVTSPEGGWKLLIVDNASTDNTPEIVRAYADRLPIEYVMEPRLGKAVALNTGLGRIDGDLVVFVDDDIIADPSLLTEWRRAADAHPDFAVFGGAIAPKFAVPPPEWLIAKDWMTILYTATIPGRAETEMRLGEPVDVYGPNMALRREIADRGFRFDESLMVGPAALIGDETEFVARLAKNGYRMRFASGPRVEHLVNARQVRWRWILRRFYRHGRTLFYFDAIRQGRDLPQVFGVPRYLLRRLAGRAVRTPVVLLSFRQERIVSQLRDIAYDLGAASQARRMRKPAAADRG